jgi:chromosome segregation ATPase
VAKDPLESARARVEAAKRELARAEGQIAAAEKEREADRARLCEVLGCKQGQEREALAELEEQAAAAEKEIAELLDGAKRARDERAAAEAPA